MLPLERNGYSAEEVRAALLAANGPRVVRFRYDLLDKDLIYKGTLSNVLEGEVNFQALATIKRTASFKIREPQPNELAINYLSDRIQPFMELRMPDGNWIEFPLGVFLLTSPTRVEERGHVFRDVEGYDSLVILEQDKFASRYTIPAGTKYTDAATAIIQTAGITRINITPKADTLTTDKEYKLGTPKLEAVNELLQAINYTSLWVDANGYCIARQYVSPQDKAPDFDYIDDHLSIIYNGMEEEFDIFGVANKWVVTESNPEKEPLVSTYTNNSPDSPTSTVNLGRTIVDFREIEEVSSQTTLDSYTQRIAQEASQIYGKIKFKTALMPMHEYMDVLRVRYLPLGIDNKFSETAWKMSLRAGGEMEHEARRVVVI